MKIIDLLNKIANEEEVPKKIYYEKLIYEWTGLNYYNSKNDEFLENHIALEDLNYPVEIIEEKKIPEKLDHLIGYDIQQFDDLKEYVEIATNDLFGKVNKIIDTLDSLIDYIKSKGE